MKTVLLFILLLTILHAQTRPKIALVLSGGGARGGAHVGVLKVLEEKRIPIDMIVGTSMGSFVGGLYASGKSADEIEKLLTTTDWKEYIRTDFNRADTPMRKKNLEYIYQGRIGLGINTDNNLVIPTGVLKREPMLFKFLEETQHAQYIKNFDELPIPFRAVATDIKNGNAVLLKSGSLAKAIYASSSIPGGFQPIKIDGIDLVDGGVSDNFPIKLAKDMGADIIIAVDVSENFDENLDVNSYFVVMGQLVNILMRKNANNSIKELTDKDVLLVPNLDGFNGLDADKYVEIIERGVEVTEDAYETKLKKLSVSEDEYREYKKKYRKKVTASAPVIDKIEIKNPTYLGDDSILSRLHVKVGEALDEARLRKDLLHIYNLMIFDSIEYEIKKELDQNILLITTTPSWDNHGEVRFAIGLEDDFKGHSSYSLKFGYTMFGLNRYGGEWKNDFEIGQRKKAYTEIFQPFDSMQRYYIRPSLSYTDTTDIIPIERYYSTYFGKSELESSRVGGSFVVGMHITTDYEVEASLGAFKDDISIETLNAKREYDSRPFSLSFRSDSLDNIYFSKSGFMSKIIWTKELKELNSDYNYEQIYAELEKPLTLFSNNITLHLKYGNTYKLVDKRTALAGSYTLGGLFNLSGYAPYSFYNHNMALGVLKYRYQLKDGGFFGALNAPLYAGFTLEAGDAWDNGEFSYNDIKGSATLYVAAETFLGPFYLAYGHSLEGDSSVYLYLGEKF